MLKNIVLEQIKESLELLLNCDSEVFKMKVGVDNLYQLFSTITDIDINKLGDGDIMLPSGKAISPSGAAHCLLEMKRTTVFLRGIKQAIDKKINESKQKISILYAGCGPYATLITPLLTIYKPEQLCVTLLDINEISLNSSECLINYLGFNKYIDRFILADASVYEIEKHYDIVISETMQSGLKNEPQVAIMQNLIPQLSNTSIFIPEEITIDVYIKKRGIWSGDIELKKAEDLKYYTNLYKVSKHYLTISEEKKIVKMPYFDGEAYDLFLNTFIKVYDNCVLDINDCSLNMPLKYFEFKTEMPCEIEFSYKQGEKPKIESKVLDYIN